jgi:hypothetical protein
MKKLLSIIMSTSIIICSLFCFNSTALAGGWVNSAQEVEFDTIYTEGWNADDPTTKPGSGYKYATFNCDAFKFVVPQKGNINVNIKSAFWEYFTNSAYVYSINDTSKPISKVSLSRNEDSGLGIYYYKCDIRLNSGTYFFVMEYSFTNNEHVLSGKTYDLILSYKPTFPNTSIKKLAPKKKSFKINFKKCSNVSGYQVKYSIKKNMSSSKTVKVSSSSSSKTVKSLKSKKKYYVKVRTYKTVKINGRNKTYYGKWSKIKTVKTK